MISVDAEVHPYRSIKNGYAPMMPYERSKQACAFIILALCIESISFTLSCQKKSLNSIAIPPQTAPELWDDHPAWSPDGRFIAYTHYALWPEDAREFGYEQVWIYDVEADTNFRFVSPGFIPRWSPDGTVLAFIFGDIYFYYIEQDTIARITYDGHPSSYDFAPDGNSLVMSSPVNPWPNSGLWLVDLEGNFYRNLIPSGSGFQPRWSRHSDLILYRKYDADYQYQIAISDSLGNFLGRVHPSTWLQNSACWGPGDSLIAIWVTNHPLVNIPGSSIWIKNRNSHRLDLFGMGWSPDWTADGQWLAFTDQAHSPYSWTIWIMRIDGSGRREISQWHPQNDTTGVKGGSPDFPQCRLTEQQKRILGFPVR